MGLDGELRSGESFAGSGMSFVKGQSILGKLKGDPRWRLGGNLEDYFGGGKRTPGEESEEDEGGRL